MQTRLVLASQSPARLAVLRGAGIEPEVVVSGVDEDAIVADSCADLALVLARLKAEAVAAGVDEVDEPTVVVGCDSVLDLDGQPLGKPHDPVTARERWLQQRGRSAVLHSGHWVIRLDQPRSPGPRSVGATGSTVVHFADPSDAEIDAYVATGEPLEVAGAFTIDGFGGAFVERIEGDHHNVLGLSLPLLRHLLGQLGIEWPSLWNRS